jgi:RNA polymerase sigma factor (sigma-70 family)
VNAKSAVQTVCTRQVRGDGDDVDNLDNLDNLDDAVATFLEVRPRLLAIAYRFLSSTTDAEDVVQETWLRWQRTDRTVVENPHALLATMTTRLAINLSQSARRRHETAMTSAAAERIDDGEDPAATVEQSDAVERAVLLVLQSLSPRERAAFVLREAFDYSYGQVAEFLHLGTANSRQLVCRARRRIATDTPAIVSAASHQRFVHAFLDAARAGDLTGFEELLTADLAA